MSTVKGPSKKLFLTAAHVVLRVSFFGVSKYVPTRMHCGPRWLPSRRLSSLTDINRLRCTVSHPKRVLQRFSGTTIQGKWDIIRGCNPAFKKIKLSPFQNTKAPAAPSEILRLKVSGKFQLSIDWINRTGI